MGAREETWETTGDEERAANSQRKAQDYTMAAFFIKPENFGT